jgi:hypothetical protein
MMKKIFYILLLFWGITPFSVMGQSLINALKFNGGANDINYGSARDASGNLYMVGTYNSTDFDADPGVGTRILTQAGAGDGYLIKLSPTNTFQWAIPFSTAGLDQVLAVAVDAGGEVYVCGSFRGVMDLDPGAGTTNITGTAVSGNFGNDIFVARYSGSGVFRWGFGLGSTTAEEAYGIAVDATGVYVVGNHQSGGAGGTLLDLDPGAGVRAVSTNGFTDIFVAKYSLLGAYTWGFSIGQGQSGDNGEQARSCALDKSGNLLVGGFFGGASTGNNIDFDPGAGTQTRVSRGGSADAFVAKYTAAGAFVWVSTFGSATNTRQEVVNQVVTDVNDAVYVTGTYQNTIDIDPGPGTTNQVSAGDSDAFLIKFNSSGALAWGRTLGGTLAEEGRVLGVDNNLYPYVGGLFRSSNFTAGTGLPVLNNTGGSAVPATDDIFVAQFSPSGTALRNFRLGGSSTGDGIGAILSNGTGNIIVTGGFTSTADFDPGAGITNLVGAGTGFDLFVARYGSFPLSDFELPVVEDGLIVYPNPANNYVTIELKDKSFNVETVQIFDLLGRLVHSENEVGTQTNIDLNKISSGIYILKVNTKEAIFSSKLYKKE